MRSVSRLLAAAALATVLASGATAATRAPNPDPPGDSGSTWDITQGWVTEIVPGRITFNIQLRPGSMGVVNAENQKGLVLVDTDSNPATGAPLSRGAEYMAVLTPIFEDVPEGKLLYHWSGSSWDPVPTPGAALTSNSTGTLGKYTVDRADLGGARSFNYWLRSMLGPLTGNVFDDELYRGRFDSAPDNGTWSYTAVQQKLRLTAGLPLTTPAGPLAGRAFTISLPLARSDGRPVGRGWSAACIVRVAGSRIGHTHALVGNRLVIRTVVPAHSRGKLLTVRMALRSGTATLARTLSFRIR